MKRQDVKLGCYCMSMLVLYGIQCLFYVANQVGIFILLGMVNANEDEGKEASMKIYASLLTLYSFVGLLKLFGLFWLLSLAWKLKNVGNEVPLTSDPEMGAYNHSQTSENRQKMGSKVR